jgi:hypothetical protein
MFIPWQCMAIYGTYKTGLKTVLQNKIPGQNKGVVVLLNTSRMLKFLYQQIEKSALIKDPVCCN